MMGHNSDDFKDAETKFVTLNDLYQLYSQIRGGHTKIYKAYPFI